MVVSLRRVVVVLPIIGSLVASAASAACPGSPDISCRTSLAASFAYSNAVENSKDKLSFKMSKGEFAHLADFGDPTTTTSYDLCIYAQGNGIAGVSVSADGDCTNGACWIAKTKGPVFKDKGGNFGGLTLISISSPPDDAKDKIVVKGKGSYLPDLSIPLAEPIIVQLRNSTGYCWYASFSGADQVKQDAVKGKMKLKVKAEAFPTCSDGARNGLETDVDCGGPCPGCGYNAGCNVHGDCAGGSCVASTCAASCTDGVLNGDETGTDCGGSCGSNCSAGAGCLENSDCSTNICRTGTCRNHRVFATSTSYNANLGGFAGADSKCEARAAAASLGGTWVAWLSSSSTNAIDRIGDYDYYNMSGYRVFANKTQIANSGIPTNSISTNEFNADIYNAYAWTGTNNNGSKIAGYLCGDWLATSGSGWLGEPNLPIGWSAYGSDSCANSWRLICFEQ